MSPEADSIIGCILAGGQSRRMGGGDKTLLKLQDKSMLALVKDRLQLQVPELILNANGDPGRFAAIGLPVIEDSIKGFAGPLAGVVAGLQWARQHRPACTHVVTAAADTPFFPKDLVERFLSIKPLASNTIAMATSMGHRHPVFGLWPVALHAGLEQWLATTDTYKVLAWARNHDLKFVDFAAIDGPSGAIDPFFNANTPEDFAIATELVIQLGADDAPEEYR